MKHKPNSRAFYRMESTCKYKILKLSTGVVSALVGFGIINQTIAVQAEEVVPPIVADEDAVQPIPMTEEKEMVEDAKEEAIELKSNDTVVEDNDAKGGEELAAKESQPSEESLTNDEIKETKEENSAAQIEKETAKKDSESIESKKEESTQQVDDHDGNPSESFKDIVPLEAKKHEGVTSSEKEDVQLNLIAKGQRETNFNRNWRISNGDVVDGEKEDLDVSNWRLIDLPNDFSIEKEPSTKNEAESGFYPGGTQWYRKNFVLSKEYLNKELSLSFDGSYMTTEVYVNGKKVGEHKNGYSPFNMNLTEYLHRDGKTENQIALKVTNETPSSRWYSGSGIYRDVSLVVTDKVHVSHNGVTVTAPQLKEQANADVDVNVKANVTNNTDSEQVLSVVNQLINDKGEKVAESTAQTVTLAAKSSQDVVSDLTVNKPTLWSLENPYLYKVKTLVSVNGEVKDTYETTYGFRYFDYDRERGFSLNGKYIKLKGVNNHHDNGALGAVANKDAIKRQLELLKEMGANSIRTSHNPTSRALIDEANRQGFLIVEEAFDGWDRYKNGNTKDFARFFNEKLGEQNAKTLANAKPDMTWAEYSLKSMINRGKNDPSIIMWSIGNEVSEGATGNTSHFGEVAKRLVQWIKEADPTRPATNGNNRIGELDAVNQAIIDAGGIVGFNYKDARTMKQQLDKHPNWKVYSSETTSAIHSRGEYGTTGRDNQKLQMSEYDNNEARVGWGASASQAWKWVVENDWNGGIYVWTGFDYIGEPTPWNGVSSGSVTGKGVMPNSSYFGILDTAGFPKDTYWLYRSMWKDDDYTLSLMSTWNDKEIVKQNGKVKVDVFTNAHRVELYQNGKKIGEATSTKYTTESGHTYRRFDSNNPYPTFMVGWQEGTLSVKGYDEEGNDITEMAKGRKSITTSYEAVALRTTTKHTEINADGTSLSYVEVDVVDRNGNIVTSSNQNIQFAISGPGKIVGVDNGNPADSSSYKANNRNAFHGKALVIVQSTREQGKITLTATADGLTSATQEISAKRLTSDETPFAESANVVKNYTVTAGQAIDLPSTVDVTMSNGEKQSKAITWTALSNEQLNTPGTYEISGMIDGQTTPIVAKVTVVKPIVAVENYSTTTTKNVVPALPAFLPAMDKQAKKVMDVPIKWNTKDVDFSQEGEVVVKGTTTVFGDEVTVQAIVKITGEAKQSENLARLAEDMPAFKNGYRIGDKITELSSPISDSLDRLNNGVKTNGSLEAERWTNWALRDRKDIDEFFLEMSWKNAHTFANLNLWHFTDNVFSRLPGDRNVRFEYWDEATSSWKTQEASNITQVSYLEGETPYGFITPVTTKKLRIWMKQAAPGKSIGLTEVEVLSHVEEKVKSNVAELASAKLGDQLVKFDENNTYTYKADEVKKLELKVKENGSATLVPVSDNEYHIVVKSEDGTQTKVYRLVRMAEEEDETPEVPETPEQPETPDESTINKELINQDKLDKLNDLINKQEDLILDKGLLDKDKLDKLVNLLEKDVAKVINKDLLNQDKLNQLINWLEKTDVDTPAINKDLLNKDKLKKLVDLLNKSDEATINKKLLDNDKLDKLIQLIEGQSQKPDAKSEIHHDAATNITVELTGEDVGRGLKLIAERVMENPFGDKLDKDLKGKVLDLYNISFVNAEGKVEQIKSKALITVPKDMAKKLLDTYYVATTGMAEKLPYETVGEFVKFKVSHFSYYALAYAAQEKQDNDKPSVVNPPQKEQPTDTTQPDDTNTTNKGGSTDKPTQDIEQSKESDTKDKEKEQAESESATDKNDNAKSDASNDEQQMMPAATMKKAEMLPETGENGAYLIFSAAALSILAGVGLVATGKKEF
ncbi:Ig-like domain-containing protein [Tuanshanicoccus lijuaniae]|uniref:glycoside hydrolase family 2 TIM barrel-domain containing protein n=1 Tax=Aerococcaceae bacterium zg-1292 TaxID=2774330 RepID=UPI0019355B71|nr:Ig-like domain-containing protein [Aerococcaceae bacterium zg-1292]QQA36325.1 Ig-like domain-containing protein [Aerococcaceae bacterium zg-1292]